MGLIECHHGFEFNIFADFCGLQVFTYLETLLSLNLLQKPQSYPGTKFNHITAVRKFMETFHKSYL